MTLRYCPKERIGDTEHAGGELDEKKVARLAHFR